MFPGPLVSPFLRNLNMHISRCSRPGPGSTLTEFLQTFVKFFTRTRFGRGGVNLLSFCYPPPVLAICICNFISINDDKKLSLNIYEFHMNLDNLVKGMLSSMDFESISQQNCVPIIKVWYWYIDLVFFSCTMP